LNGEHGEIFDKIEELQETINNIQINAAETRQDVKYLGKSLDNLCDTVNNKLNQADEEREDLKERVNWNENKIYLGIGAVTLAALAIQAYPYRVG